MSYSKKKEVQFFVSYCKNGFNSLSHVKRKFNSLNRIFLQNLGLQKKAHMLWVILKKLQFCESFYFKNGSILWIMFSKKGLLLWVMYKNGLIHWVNLFFNIDKRFNSSSLIEKKGVAILRVILRKRGSILLSHILKTVQLLESVWKRGWQFFESKFWKDQPNSSSHVENMGSILWVFFKKNQFFASYFKESSRESNFRRNCSILWVIFKSGSILWVLSVKKKFNSLSHVRKGVQSIIWVIWKKSSILWVSCTKRC